MLLAVEFQFVRLYQQVKCVVYKIKPLVTIGQHRPGSSGRRNRQLNPILFVPAQNADEFGFGRCSARAVALAEAAIPPVAPGDGKGRIQFLAAAG
jgi:hypothetical protein